MRPLLTVLLLISVSSLTFGEGSQRKLTPAIDTSLNRVQQVEVDISASRDMYEVLRAMGEGASKEKVSQMLDALLQTRPLQMMFKHYNRSWRPNELPPTVFKRMILSLQFPNEYSAGENARADVMRSRWVKFYPDLTLYEQQLRQLETADLKKLINDGVRYAQQWLPRGWEIPKFYVPIIPNGGSPAFTIEATQGYDFLQLSQQHPGKIDFDWLVGTIAHESHHLGMRSSKPANLSPEEDIAYKVITLCIAEGIATEFISGPPPGRLPALRSQPFHVFTPDLILAWNEHVKREEEMVKRQSELLDSAIKGDLTQEAFDRELREYWLNGAVGRAYVLGADMFGAIYLAFGKKGVFQVLKDPRKFFYLYNRALDVKPRELRRCVRVPTKTVMQALALGTKTAKGSSKS